MKTNLSKLSLLISIICCTIGSAQDTHSIKQKSFIENVRYGGGVGLSFGNNFFSGSLTPFALYEINPYLFTGAGLNLTYSSFNNNDLFAYGGSLISIARPLPELQFSAEFEQLWVNRSVNGGALEDSYWYPALFLGVGYTSGPITIGIRYDVIYDDNKSIYADAYMPFVRILF